MDYDAKTIFQTALKMTFIILISNLVTYVISLSAVHSSLKEWMIVFICGIMYCVLLYALERLFKVYVGRLFIIIAIVLAAFLFASSFLTILFEVEESVFVDWYTRFFYFPHICSRLMLKLLDLKHNIPGAVIFSLASATAPFLVMAISSVRHGYRDYEED
ncbi:MAG: hypothetical protein IJS03_04800 [Eubacterium sp.]|nr:hypothetical protein [Eubacterium sp.]